MNKVFSILFFVLIIGIVIFQYSRNTETNINIELESDEEWERFWQTHTVSHYIIKNGFNVETES